jgi:hypothetical protein
MRFTFVILLFCGLGADAQMIIKAHANYRPYAVASANLLLDQYSGAAAAYSLRKLRTAYTGSAIRVRRSNDNTEQDIGFTSSGDLDTTSLKTFVGAGNSGFVTTWYDQSGNARNATQATAANQPRVVNAGTVERRTNLPSVFFNGATYRLLTSAFSYNDGNYTAFACSNQVDTTSRVMLSHDSSATGRRAPLYIRFSGPPQTVANTTGTTTFITDNGNSISVNQTYIFSAVKRSNNTEIYVNGNTNGATTLSANSVNFSQSLKIGSQFFNGTNHYNGYIHEIILYGSDKSTDRTGIETNINSYYAIY